MLTPRRATPADAPQIARLNRHIQSWHAAQYPETFHAEPDPAEVTAHFAARLAEQGVTCLLLGDPPQAYALLSLQDRPASPFSPARRRLLVDHIAVDPAFRRQGLGRALLAAARAEARALACDEILLDTWEANHDAHRFFAAQGFAPRRSLWRALP